MIRRFYVHNFRCLENFELPLAGQSSTLLIGDNKSGKSTLRYALRILQRIARGESRVDNLVKPTDFSGGRSEVPMRLELEVTLNNRTYEYRIVFEQRNGGKTLTVAHEILLCDGLAVLRRDRTQHQTEAPAETPMGIDWTLVALPIALEKSSTDPLFLFRQWLSRSLILSPIAPAISGTADGGTLHPHSELNDFGDWFSGILSLAPAAYSRIEKHLKQTMPDFEEIRKVSRDNGERFLQVRFSNTTGSISLPFRDLSDGEKSFMICALVLAANDAYGPLFCFWDEPDSYLALKEVGHFVMALRKAFNRGGQFLATSHNPEAIRTFSEENTLFLFRKSHLEPTIVRRLDDLQIHGDLVGALIRGDVEP